MLQGCQHGNGIHVWKHLERTAVQPGSGMSLDNGCSRASSAPDGARSEVGDDKEREEVDAARDAAVREAYRGDARVSWLLDYGSRTNAVSELEIEAAMALPELRARRRMTREERQELNERRREEAQSLTSKQLVLLVQTKAEETARVDVDDSVTAVGMRENPTNFSSSQHDEKLQSMLRSRSLRAAQTMPSAQVLQHVSADRERAISEIQKFVKTEIVAFIENSFSPVDGPLRVLTNNLMIDEMKQALWLKSMHLRNSSIQVGRKEILQQLFNYCNQERFTRPLVLLAPSGAGKTALLQQFLAQYLDSNAPFRGRACPSQSLSSASTIVDKTKTTKGFRHRGRVFVQTHFTGIGTGAASPERMLHRFCTRMASHLHLRAARSVPKRYSTLCDTFRDFCERAATSYRGMMTLVVVDGLEQLDPAQVTDQPFAVKSDGMNAGTGVTPAVEWLPELVASGGKWADREGFRGGAQATFPVRCICSLACNSADICRGGNNLKTTSESDSCWESSRADWEIRVLKTLRCRKYAPYEIVVPLIQPHDRGAVLMSLLVSRHPVKFVEGTFSLQNQAFRRNVATVYEAMRLASPLSIESASSPSSPMNWSSAQILDDILRF